MTKAFFAILLLAANPNTRAWTCHNPESRAMLWTVPFERQVQAEADPYEVERAKTAAADAVTMTAVTIPASLPAIFEHPPTIVKFVPLVPLVPLAPIAPVAPRIAAAPALHLVWAKNLDGAKYTSEKLQKPTYVFWFGDGCQACELDEQRLLGNAEVRSYLAENFVCSKQNVKILSDSQRLKLGIKSWPKHMVTTVGCKTYVHVERSKDPAVFLNSLRVASEWANKNKGK